MSGNRLSLDTLLKYTFEMQGTDLHIAVGSLPLVRVSSKLVRIEEGSALSPEDTYSYVMDCTPEPKFEILEARGEVDFSFSRAGIGRFRANVFKQRGSLSMAIRSLPFTIPEFASLGLPPSVLSLTEIKSGLILATGATGSGKSTTLASMVDVINSKRNCHIITIEDPIEYLHRHKSGLVNQREVNWDTLSFASALRAALREDPDVILVGEMRDPETIAIALTAAETGHLVLSSLHTGSAAKTVNRILDAFPHDQHEQVRTQLATVLEGVVSQQLIPRIDGQGLVLASEVMLVNTAIRNLIREGKSHQINSMIQTGSSQGMQTMDSRLAELYLSGQISYEDALNRVQDLQTFAKLCGKG